MTAHLHIGEMNSGTTMITEQGICQGIGAFINQSALLILKLGNRCSMLSQNAELSVEKAAIYGRNIGTPIATH